MKIQEIESEPLSNNWAGLNCYLWGVLFASIFLVVKPCKTNQFVRFHAFQSLIFFVSLFTLQLFVIPYLGSIGDWIYAAFIAVWIVLMVTAFKGKTLKLPLIGDLAKHFAERISSQS